jgi:hypothetical protein
MDPKESRNFSKQFRERVKMERGRENGLIQKDLKLKYFYLSKNIHPFIMRLLELSLSLTLFFNTFSFLFLSFSAPSLYFGILKIFEEKINFKFLFGWDGSGYTKNMKIGEMQIYWRWTHTP